MPQMFKINYQFSRYRDKMMFQDLFWSVMMIGIGSVSEIIMVYIVCKLTGEIQLLKTADLLLS